MLCISYFLILLYQRREKQIFCQEHNEDGQDLPDQVYHPQEGLEAKVSPWLESDEVVSLCFCLQPPS